MLDLFPSIEENREEENLPYHPHLGVQAASRRWGCHLDDPQPMNCALYFPSLVSVPVQSHYLEVPFLPLYLHPHPSQQLRQRKHCLLSKLSLIPTSTSPEPPSWHVQRQQLCSGALCALSASVCPVTSGLQVPTTGNEQTPRKQ